MSSSSVITALLRTHTSGADPGEVQSCHGAEEGGETASQSDWLKLSAGVPGHSNGDFA